MKMEIPNLIATSLAAAFALACLAWFFARLMRRPLQRQAEEAALGKDYLKRLQPGWLRLIGYFLVAVSLTPWVSIPWWIVFAILTSLFLIAAFHHARLLRTEADDSPIRTIARRHRRSSFALAAFCATCSVLLLAAGRGNWF